MTQYSKIEICNRLNGLFKGNALLVKTDEGVFYLVFRGGDFTFDGDNVAIPSATFEARDGVGIRLLANCNPLDSFVTFLLAVRAGEIECLLSNYKVGLLETVQPLHSVFSVNLDDVFAQENNRIALMGGILVKRGYTQEQTYSGFGSYHSNQRTHHFNTPVTADKPWRIGVELECYARSREAYNRITGARTNWFQCESDASLTERQFPIEIKTIPLKACDAKSVDFWNEPMKRLGELAVSKGCSTTGLHVHISKEILGSTETEREKNLSKLCVFYSYYVEDDPQAHDKNVVICGRERGYHGGYSKTELGDFSKMVGINKVGESDEAFGRMADGIKREYRSVRSDINIGNWNTYGTIEFRKGDGRISKTRLSAICTWWEQMCLYCKDTHPRDFSFQTFFDKVCRENPSVAYFFQQDEEQ